VKMFGGTPMGSGTDNHAHRYSVRQQEAIVSFCCSTSSNFQ